MNTLKSQQSTNKLIIALLKLKSDVFSSGRYNITYNVKGVKVGAVVMKTVEDARAFIKHLNNINR